MYYIYRDSIYGTELLDTVDTLEKAEAIKQRYEETKPNELWTLRITDIDERAEELEREENYRKFKKSYENMV